MKLIEELPKVFDDFGEQRKNSFITAMELKKKGIPMVGTYAANEASWSVFRYRFLRCADVCLF